MLGLKLHHASKRGPDDNRYCFLFVDVFRYIDSDIKSEMIINDYGSIYPVNYNLLQYYFQVFISIHVWN